MMKKNVFAVLVFGFVCMVSRVGLADALIFFYSPGCMYCQMWEEEILPIYDKSEEGKRLPLRRVNIDKGMPQNLKHLTTPTFTPTFVVVDNNNQEAGRILGYNREFFWGFLQKFIRVLDQKAAS